MIHNDFEDKTPTTKGKEVAVEKQNDTAIVADRLSGLAKFATSIERLEEMTNRDFLIDGLIQEKSHTVIYGASGTGKTTFMFYLIKEAKQNNSKL